MTPSTPPDAAAELRRAVQLLSERMPVDPGSLVPEARVEHLAALAERLEHEPTGARASAEELTALDAWIRIADGFTLHDDAPEAAARATVAERLRAVRALVAPPARHLSLDPRDAEPRDAEPGAGGG